MADDEVVKAGCKLARRDDEARLRERPQVDGLTPSGLWVARRNREQQFLTQYAFELEVRLGDGRKPDSQIQPRRAQLLNLCIRRELVQLDLHQGKTRAIALQGRMQVGN